jgi:hypothetical protein
METSKVQGDNIMQYTAGYAVSIIHHQTEVELTRGLERRRIARERAEEQRAASPAVRSTHNSDRPGPVTRMPRVGLVHRLGSVAAAFRRDAGPRADSHGGAAPVLAEPTPGSAPAPAPAPASKRRELAHR